MKKVISLLLAFTICLSLCACGQVEKNDSGFIANLGSALDARWRVAEQGGNDKDSVKSAINTELSVLGSFDEYTFEDSKLEEYAEQYFEALNNQLEGIQYQGVDNSLYFQYYVSGGYNQRVKLIYLINSEYGLTVNKNNASILEEFLTLGEKITAIENLTVQPLTLKSTGDECELTLENTTKYELSSIKLNFNLLDDAGNIVGTEYAYIGTLLSGNKETITIRPERMDFTQAQMNIEMEWEEIATEFVPVEYINDMIINISAQDLPKEVNRGYGNRIESSCIVEDFSYEVDWYDGKGSVDLHFSGTKTYDKDGENTNGYCGFVYKLIGEDGGVVDSGSVMSSSIKTNETFNESGYAFDITPGNYTLVIENDM